MSNFPENLSLLRRRAGYTQEELAEALGLSRQAVGKWESGQAMPEAATLPALADLLNCTLDQLLREELTEDALAPDEDEAAAQAVYDAYAAQVESFAKSIAAGVFLVLAGVAALMVLYNMGFPEWIPVVGFFLFLMVAVYLFITAGMARDDFRKTYPVIPDMASEEEKAAFRQTYRHGIAESVVGILADVALLAALGYIFDHDETVLIYCTALFMLLLGVCVWRLVYLGCLSDKYDQSELDLARQGTRANGICGAIMLGATAVFLLLGFRWAAWHPGWLVFLVGAGLCALVRRLPQK